MLSLVQRHDFLRFRKLANRQKDAHMQRNATEIAFQQYIRQHHKDVSFLETMIVNKAQVWCQ